MGQFLSQIYNLALILLLLRSGVDIKVVRIEVSHILARGNKFGQKSGNCGNHLLVRIICPNFLRFLAPKMGGAAPLLVFIVYEGQ